MARFTIRTTASFGGFTGTLNRVLKAWEAQVRKDIRREVAMIRAVYRKVGRRVYQRELRRAAPAKTKALRRSIRVSARNEGKETVRLRVRMKFYGAIMNSAPWSKHRGWANEARRRSIPIIQREVAQALAQRRNR